MRKAMAVWSTLLLALLAWPAAAQSSKEYATMAKQAWAAFKCSVWAGYAGNEEEQERLLLRHGANCRIHFGPSV
jgi:hypothetical protein